MFGEKDILTTKHYQWQGEIVYLPPSDREEKSEQTGRCSVLIKVGMDRHFTNCTP